MKKTGKTLVVVESPSKGHKLQEYLGSDYIVLASMGHICELASGGMRYGIGVDIKNDFKPSYTIIKERIETLDAIINAANECDSVLLASDDDREGESIAAHIQQYILTTGKPIRRIVFGEITKAAILNAVVNPRDVDMQLVHSQEGRRVLDRLIGFLVSPYLMQFYGNNLSAGRVQSVATRIICDRENEIQSFIPEEFWNIYAKFKTANNEIIDSKLAARPTNKQDATKLLTAIKDSSFLVSSIVSQKKNEKPPAPLITASLQQIMAKRFSFEPDQTMKAAQYLYENGYISYHRTDSTRLSEESLISVRKWIQSNDFDLPKKPNVYATSDNAQDAHTAITPTNINTVADKSMLTGDEKIVYDSIWKYFVASQMNPAIWDTMTVSISNKDKSLIFTTSGKALAYKGFLSILGNIDISKIDIPNLKQNEQLTLDKAKSEQKFTQPAPRYNVASLLKELENKQIGRPSSYADITSKITARNYVEKNGNVYRPTDLGKKITEILTSYFPFMEYKYSADLEKMLDKIAVGQLDYVTMLKQFYTPFKKQLTKAYMDNGSGICKQCGSPTVVRDGKNGKFIGCSEYSMGCKFTQTYESAE